MKDNQTVARFLKVKTFPFIINDDKGNEIYCEYSDGRWYKGEFDDKGNEIYCEYSTGFWTKREYNNQGNQIYFEDSDGFIIDKRPKPITELEKQVEAMRDAIKEVEKLLLSINLNDIFEDSMRNHAKLALTKLKPFLNP